MPARGLLQFRLRTVLVAMLACTLGIAWFGYRWREGIRENTVIAYLMERGATTRVMPSLEGPLADVVFHVDAMRQQQATGATGSASSTSTPPPKLTLEDFEQLRM